MQEVCSANELQVGPSVTEKNYTGGNLKVLTVGPGSDAQEWRRCRKVFHPKPCVDHLEEFQIHFSPSDTLQKLSQSFCRDRAAGNVHITVLAH